MFFIFLALTQYLNNVCMPRIYPQNRHHKIQILFANNEGNSIFQVNGSYHCMPAKQKLDLRTWKIIIPSSPKHPMDHNVVAVTDVRTDERESSYSDSSLCSTVKYLPTSLSLCNSFFSLYKKRVNLNTQMVSKVTANIRALILFGS